MDHRTGSLGTVKAKSATVRRFGGLAILLAVALATTIYEVRPAPTPDPKTIPVRGIIGGKVAFFQDPAVIDILRERYGLAVEPRRVGSIDMIQQCQTETDLDFCWPSSQTAGGLIVQNLGSAALNSEVIFNSPIVFYTWTPIADALIAQGIVVKTGETYYVEDLPRLVEMVESGVNWSEIGLPQLYDKVRIHSSDPTASNTGNSFAGLLANTLNGGQVVDETSVETILPRLQAVFGQMGLLPQTTTQLFEQFLTLGMGAAPIIVAYESNLVEYSLAHPSESNQQALREQVRTLYPKPTVWSSQPMIALTDGGKRLIDALRDPEIQSLGWKHHGFRTAVPGVLNPPSDIGLVGVPPSIDSIIQMPNPATMQRIIQALDPNQSAVRRRAPFA